MKTIAVNGASSTQEIYLDEKHRWSSLIGAKYNLALGGGSNDRMFRTTIKFLNHTPIDVLILGWVMWNRTSLTKNNGSYYVICNAPAHDEDDNQEQDDEVYKFYLKKMFNEYLQLENTLNYMLHIQNYCLAKGIRLVNFASGFGPDHFAYSELEKIAKESYVFNNKDKKIVMQVQRQNTERLTAIIDQLDPNTWVNKRVFFSMEEGLKDLPKIDSMGHFGIEGSKQWAQIIQQHI